MDKDKVRKIYLNGRAFSLKALLEEIERHDYQTVSQIKGAISNELEFVERAIERHE